MRVRGPWERFWFVLLLALVVLAWAACGSEDEEFRLVFYSERDGDSDIYLMDTDGSNVQQLTNEAGRDYEAKASADGRLLVFGSQRAGGENGLLYVMNVDGSGVRPLTAANEGQEINDEYPDWSPDGRRVVFQRVIRPAEGGAESDLWLVDIESGRETQLTDTPDVWDSTPSFTANGTSVLFENSSSGDFELYQLRLDDMQVSQLTESEGTEIEAKQSPDGERIAFAFERDGDFDIYVMRNDGSDLRALTDNDAADRCPQWSPDGKRISFVSERDGDLEVYLMNSDGSDQRRLTNSPGADEVPDWVASP